MQQANLSQSGVTANLRQQQFARIENLANRGFATRAVYDELGSGVSASRLEAKASGERLVQAQAALQRAQRQLAKTAVRSPASGTVVGVNIKSAKPRASSIGMPARSRLALANVNSSSPSNVARRTSPRSARTGSVDPSRAYPDRPRRRHRSCHLAETEAHRCRGGSQARTYTVKGAEPARDMVLRPEFLPAEIFTVI